MNGYTDQRLGDLYEIGRSLAQTLAVGLYDWAENGDDRGAAALCYGAADALFTLGQQHQDAAARRDAEDDDQRGPDTAEIVS